MAGVEQDPYITAQINAVTYNSTSKSYRGLQNTIKQYIARTGQEFNIVDQARRLKYNIPDGILPVFFELLNKCYNEKLVLGFSERQTDAPSGIMLDFDIEQKDKNRSYTDSHLAELNTNILRILIDMVECKQDTIYTLVTTKHTVKYKESIKCFKDGFHILIPGIKVSKKFKKLFISNILESDIIPSVFEDVGLTNKILDTHSAVVMPLFVGNCKQGGVAYDVQSVYKTVIRNSNVSYSSVVDHKSFNLVYDFSINYSQEDSVVIKNEYPVQQAVENLLEQQADVEVVDSKENDSLSILGMHDPDADYIINMVRLLSVSRCETYNKWFGVICALAYMGEKYKPLALEFSNKRQAGARSEFEEVWFRERSRSNRYNYSEALIAKYAMEDNPEGFEKIQQCNISRDLLTIMYDKKIKGDLGHYTLAKTLYRMVGTKFIVDYKPGGGKAPTWYEFVLPDDIQRHGEVYKWRWCQDAHKLDIYLSEHMTKIIDRVLAILVKQKESAETEDTRSYYSFVYENVLGVGRKLYDCSFKNGIIKQATSLFRKPGFVNSLNLDENVMGVGNGILQFEGKRPKLIQSVHQYPIDRFSSIDYHPIDPNNSTIQAVYKSIWDLFPDNEKDAFHYILFFMSTSLTGRLKACLFLTLQGNGANGKSYLMELLRNTLGSVDNNGYGCKLPIQFLIEKEKASANANPMLMSLQYARIAYFSESEKSEQLRVSKKKLLTSHEPISARQLYGEQRNFLHKSNFILESNYTLSIDSVDHGTWRRERYYNMKIKFCDNPEQKNERQDDPSFSIKKARDPMFLSGMLSILSMYLAVLDHKYGNDINKVPCPTIMRETETFRNSQDTINRYLIENIVITDPNTEITLASVVDGYCEWYDKQIKKMNHDRLDITLTLKNSRISGGITKKSNKQDYVKGYRILESGDSINDNESFMDDFNVSVDSQESYTDSNTALQMMYEIYNSL